MPARKLKIPDTWKPPKALPKNIGDCIDLLVAAKAERKRREAEAVEVKKEEDRIEEHILGAFQKEKINGAKGKLGTVSLVEKDVPRVTDLVAFGEYVAANKAWDMLYRRAVEDPCNARWEAGQQIPGVEKFHKKDIRLTEVK